MTPQQEVEYIISWYEQLLKEMIELTNEDSRERCVAICRSSEDGSLYPTEVEVGDQWGVPCPIEICFANKDVPVGKIHTHPPGPDKDVLSSSDYYGLLDPWFLHFSCLAYEDDGEYYLKCALQPETDEYKYDPIYERLKWCLDKTKQAENIDQVKILLHCISRSTEELVERYGEIWTWIL